MVLYKSFEMGVVRRQRGFAGVSSMALVMISDLANERHGSTSTRAKNQQAQI